MTRPMRKKRIRRRIMQFLSSKMGFAQDAPVFGRI